MALELLGIFRQVCVARGFWWGRGRVTVWNFTNSVSEHCFNSADPKEKPYSAVDYPGQHCS